MTHSNPNTPRVQPHSFLTLHYRLSGPAGDVINTLDGSPATLTLGSGQLAPALEATLLDLPEGTHTIFDLPAGAAFGTRSPDLLQWLARQELIDMGVANEEYAVGEVLKFPTPDGLRQFAGTIRDFRNDGDAVLMDFNHPLASQPITFEVHLLGVL